MTWHLVRAQLRFMRWQLLVVVMMTTLTIFTDNDRMASFWVLAGSFNAGGFGTFWARTTRVLPIERTRALQSAWLTIMFLPATAATVRLLSLAAPLVGWTTRFDVERMLILFVFEAILVGGVFVGLQRDQALWEGFRRLTLRQALQVPLILLWMGAAFAGPELLPAGLADARWFHIAGTAIGLAIALRPIVERWNEWPTLGTVHHSVPREHTPARKTRTLTNSDTRAGGIGHLWRKGLYVSIVVAALSIAGGITMQILTKGVLSPPFDDRAHPVGFLLTGGVMFLLLLGSFAQFGSNGLPAKRLKALPIPAGQLVALFTLRPLATPLIHWSLCVIWAVAQTQQWPPHLQGDLFIVVCGQFAIAGAVALRYPMGSSAHGLSMLPSMVLLIGLIGSMSVISPKSESDVLSYALYAIGIVSLAGAALLNWHTFTRLTSAAPAFRSNPVIQAGASR